MLRLPSIVTQSKLDDIGIPVAALGVSVLYAFYRSLRWVTRPWFSNLKIIPGPPNSSPLFGFLFGHIPQMINGRLFLSISQWYEEFGPIFTINTVLGDQRCITTDNKAIGYILTNTNKYHKPEAARYQLSFVIGDGLVLVEGNDHRIQRRVMNPAFSSGHLKDIFPSFQRKAAELRDILQQQITIGQEFIRVDILHWLSRATIDIIGLAGFNYDFDTLRKGESGNELAASLHRLNSPKKFPIVMALKISLPPFRIIFFDYIARESRWTRTLLRRIGLRLIGDRMQEMPSEKNSLAYEESVSNVSDRDLLSLMIKSNKSTTIPPEQRLSVNCMLDQIPTFLIAGHDTTATACIASRYTNAPTRRASSSIPNRDTPVTVDALNALPYLEAVVREMLRFHPPIDVFSRVAVEDDVLPLERPFIDKRGQQHAYLYIKKGDHILIPIKLINQLKETWGEDADKFNPDRWLGDLPPAVKATPALWANLLTFGAGPRSCIGFRFAVLEMKILLLYLLRSFEINVAVQPDELMGREMVVTRPVLKARKEDGPQLPILLRPLSDKS
ncbi:SubName: Full=Related to Cytochrome P450 {ECO:0000313/EMBL:CCA75456.1} [Serendipita indica DSM 11827]|nr:SubName: Full=Related to Cytochrome P450 {ECO:0000313/EMBL:CCA75456.1} [Serendipita indica DSM 11827]